MPISFKNQSVVKKTGGSNMLQLFLKTRQGLNHTEDEHPP
jgi:hypothetical protein